ncbi:uncharacterized protein [Nicotiana tomentosiformis]|uniref:uncharacterized protein n=1 Tax=Nicotiana tomentosiformis TaxID=4098 RepID=UPI00388CA864
MRQAGRKQVIPRVSNMVEYKVNFKGGIIPLKFEAQHMWNQKVIVEIETIEPDRYHVGHVYFYLSWLVDDIAEDVKPGVNLEYKIIDDAVEAQVKYRRLRKRVFESEARHLEQHKVDMEAINEWKKIATKSTKRLEYLEQGLMEFEGKMRKRLSDCQNTNGNEGGHLAKSYLLLDMRDLGNIIDGVKRAKYGEDVEPPEGYEPPKFEMFDGTGDPKVHLRTYCDKLVGVGRDERIRMKIFRRSLTGDACLGTSVKTSKKWVNWVSMASNFMDRFRFNTENALDVFYIQNLKMKPIETFREYATRWRSEATKVRPALEEEQMNTFFVRAQDPQYYERMMVIEKHKFSDIIKLGERIEEGIKSGMVTNFEALQATNKALQSGGISKKKDVGAAAGYVTPIPAVSMENSSQWINPNKTCAYHSGMEGHTIDECHTLKDKIQTLIDTKVIQAKEDAPNVRNNPLPDHRAPTPSYESAAIPWDYVAEERRKGKAKMEETGTTQGMTRTCKVYTSEHLGGTSKEVASKPPISILSLLQNSETHRNTLMKVLSEAYVPTNITSGEMANMVGQVLESLKITFHEDELPPKELSHNRALHITMQFDDKFIARVLIDKGSNLNMCPLTTLKRLGKGMHEIRVGSMNVKAFDGSQRATIGEINLSLQMGPTWFVVEFQVLDISATYNLLLG